MLYDGTYTRLEPLLVLVITSRRSKVNELLTEDDLPADGKVGKWDSYHYLYDDEFEKIEPTGKYLTLEDEYGLAYKVFQRSVVCTNAFIEKYLQYRYQPQNITTHLWELFDLIVIDEAHSLVLDASYQSAPFYVSELIREFIERHKQAEKDPEHYRAPRCGNLLLMTGSAAPMKQLSLPAVPHVIDRMEACINVVPHNIHFLTLNEAKQQLKRQLAAGEKAVYFTNHTPKLAEFCSEAGISTDKVAVSFSKKENREKLSADNAAAYDRMVCVEESIAQTNLIPDDVCLWLTTSRNKEGINIENKDIDHLYVESHIQSDIIQMAGRIRVGVKHMYIIVDSSDNYSNEWKNEADFCQQELASSFSSVGSLDNGCNDFLQTLCIRNGLEHFFNEKKSETTAYSKSKTGKPIADYIDYIHEKFPYIRYSYFDNTFRFYRMRKVSRALQRQELRRFNEALETSGAIEDLFRQWFPTAKVHSYISPEEKQNAQARAYLEKLGITDSSKRFTSTACREILEKLNSIYGENLTSINSLLKKCMPIKLQRVSNARGTTDYKLFHVVSRDKAS